MQREQSIIGRSSDRAAKRKFIINEIRRLGQLSRSALAESTGLSPATVSSIVSELLEEDLVVEDTASVSAGGRRPTPMRINYTTRLAIGIKLKSDSIECLLTDMSTAPIDKLTKALPSLDPEAVCQICEEAIAQLMETQARDTKNLIGVGVSIPAFVDAETGVCKTSHRFGWKDIHFAGMLQNKLGIPVKIEDDSHAFALAHALFGVGINHASFATVAVGEGISYEMILDGKLHRGNTGAAGKLGHMCHDPHGARCECGRYGCLQVKNSISGMLSTLDLNDPQWSFRTRLDRLLACLASGDEKALSTVRDAGYTVGKYLADMTAVTDVDPVVIGGEVVELGEYFFDAFNKALNKYSLHGPIRTYIDNEDNFWSRGAAALVTQEVFGF
ncbi:N-acetylglucosamine repressor [Kushneria phyllosphaerae]|uniref:N-acetylglucosamine repressor n=2 Tax=Kushneria phyllosphaerae TaxID=2100822 RepID=A0A2R8CIV3_9GAMM|nr:N-acetylglucosamine repressor [Kushneria phyllosphaerae]